ncbi:MAG: phage integrase N-terminal SAM-like domain-containing protein [Candidatus Aenigmatarchaeota archaeon]
MPELYGYEKGIERGLLAIKQIDERTYEKVKEFVRKLETNNYSKRRIFKYIYFLKNLRELLGKDFSEAEKQDVEELVIKLNSNNYSENSKADFKKIFKFYYCWLKFGKFEGKEKI